MGKETRYKTAGAIGLCCYAFTALVYCVCSRIPTSYRWVCKGEDMLAWFCLFFFMLMNIIVMAAFVQLCSCKNWNKKNGLVIVDWLFLIATVFYILLWLFIWLLSMDDHHYVL